MFKMEHTTNISGTPQAVSLSDLGPQDLPFMMQVLWAEV